MRRAASVDAVTDTLARLGGRATYARLSVALVPSEMTDERLCKLIGEALETGAIREAGRGPRTSGPVYEVNQGMKG
jgi:hypothetical protein